MAVFLLLTIISLLATILFVVKYYFDKRKLFQLGSKLPGPKPLPIIGNAWDFLDTDLGTYQLKYILMADQYNKNNFSF